VKISGMSPRRAFVAIKNRASRVAVRARCQAVMLALRLRRRRPRLFDCCLLFEETELLLLRFMEYYEVVDYFVIVESKKTFRGNDHEPIFLKNRELYGRYLDKVIYLLIDQLPPNSETDMWISETYQRNQIAQALKGRARFGDVVILSDADEFWSVEHLDRIRRVSKPIVFRQKLFYYFLDCQSDVTWRGTCCAPYGMMTPQMMRVYGRSDETAEMVDGGWHYSYLGGIERIRSKLENLSDAHTIIDKVGTDEQIAAKASRGTALWDDEVTYSFVEMDRDHAPRSINSLIERFPYLAGKSASAQEPSPRAEALSPPCASGN